MLALRIAARYHYCTICRLWHDSGDKKRARAERSDSFGWLRLFAAASLQDHRNQVDQREDDDPHDIDEVPVHLGSLDREMMFGGEIAAHRADQADQQEDRADRHVQ